MLEAHDLKLIGQEVAKVVEDNVNPQFEELRKEIKDIRSDISDIRANMVTIDYLDEKMADLRGDLVVLMRKEDTKLRSLVNILHQKNVLSEADVKSVLTMEPFPQPL